VVAWAWFTHGPKQSVQKDLKIMISINYDGKFFEGFESA